MAVAAVETAGGIAVDVIECETRGKSRSGYSVEKDFLDSAFVHLLLDSGPKGSDNHHTGGPSRARPLMLVGHLQKKRVDPLGHSHQSQ